MIIPHLSMTVLQAHQLAKQHGMFLIRNKQGEFRISPVIPEGWVRDGAWIKQGKDMK